MEQGRFQGEQIPAHQEGARPSLEQDPYWGCGVQPPGAGCGRMLREPRRGGAAGAGGRVDGGNGPTEVTTPGDEDPHG